MMLFSIGRTLHSITILVLVTSTYLIVVNSRMACHVIWFSFLQASMTIEVITTCVIAYLTYIMHSSFKSIEVKKQDRKWLFKNSIMYITSFVSNLYKL